MAVRESTCFWRRRNLIQGAATSEDIGFNPSNADATFIQSTRMQRFLKNHLNLIILVFIG